ncbi:hypothetical protein ID866_8796 [Astraeus odoratus]|nr:hypothetical protein ID866_8796 [Astraeus odoratus]
MMRDKIMNAFPANPADLPKSFVKHLLTQLSTLFHGLPPNALVEDRLRLVGQYKRYVTDVWPALSVLLDTDFAAIGASRAKRSKFVPKVNEVPLNNLGVAIPSNADEAKMLMDEILCTLKSILHFYLDLLSEPDLADFVWDAYFSGNDPLRPELQGQSKVHADVDPVPAIHPQLQSFKAALQVDNVEGFGRWEIIMSSGATKDLKEIKRSNKERAEFVVNKIFQLSKGRFSGNNQRRLNGPSHGIPIYQAEVLSNLRIVAYLNGSLMRMRCVFRTLTSAAGLIADEEVQLPFQLTPNEWEIVQSTTSCFVIGRSGTGKTTVMLYKMLGIHRAWQKTSSCPKPRQVFVTRSRVLRAKVEESFDNWLDFFSLEGRTREELKWRRDQGIGRPGIAKIDPMNASDCRIGTPRKFSELTDHDFPLFITFDHLARLVAADLQHDHNPYAKLLTCLDENYSLIKYDDFENHYWTRLPQHATRGLEPWLVFSEFMGVIKGSEAALHQPGGSLNKETYVEMPARTHQSFAHQREALYKLFEAYCFLKQQKWSYDMADRTYSVLKPLLFGVPLEGQRVHYMYVDEVQDLLPIDALLLRILCRNPDGLIWAGDTAQTISAGSSFRFEDLTAFMYRAERDSTMGLAMCRIKPIVFQLTTNYRSHSGIINCAQSVIELIGRFWPNTIDILRPEHGIIFGREPVFFSDWEEGMFSPEKFFSGMKTLQDSKGLEFDDVFLYNFFEDSAVGYAQWSLVLAGCGDDRMSLAFERDESKFAVLCTELKALYVGITRSRNKLYLLDKSNKSKPMRTFWSSRDLIRRAPAETNIFQYVVRSTADEWAAAGRNFFAAEKFKEAIRCFQRAGDSYQCELRIAQAFQYREDAKHASPVSEARSAFLVAGDAFTDCAKEALNFERRMAWYNNAGDCYSNGHDVNRAGISYMMAENFMAATRVYYDAKNFDEIIQMFECHHTKIMPDYSSTLFTVCRQHYGSKNIRPPKPLFPSIEEELDYLKMKGFDNTLIDVSECHGKNMRAAEVYLGRGQPVKAIQSCLKHQQDDATLECAVNIALVNLWSWYSFAAAPAKKFLRKGTTATRSNSLKHSTKL